MHETQVIHLNNVPEKWVKLLLQLQNALPGAFQLVFPDAKTAQSASSRIRAAIDRYPVWFHMVICQRDRCVYVIKTQYVQKVMIRDG